MQVGVAVAADYGAPVAVDGRHALVEVPMPAAPRAIIDDAPGEPVTLQQPDRGIGGLNQAGEPCPPACGVGGLVVS
jgi:hypothetical protein